MLRCPLFCILGSALPLSILNVVNDDHFFPRLIDYDEIELLTKPILSEATVNILLHLLYFIELCANQTFFLYVLVSTVSVPRSARFSSCSDCARSSMVCLSSWTRLQSTCSGLQSPTLLGGKHLLRVSAMEIVGNWKLWQVKLEIILKAKGRTRLTEWSGGGWTKCLWWEQEKINTCITIWPLMLD